MNKRAIFWFRRDLRIEDNIGLYHAVKENKGVLPIFILDENILRRIIRENPRIGFLLDCIRNLGNKLKSLGSFLLVLKGKPEEILPDIINKYKIDAVYLNKAYSFDGIRRDKNMKDICLRNKVAFKEFEDTLLVPPYRIEQRKVFTHFYKLWLGVEKRTDLLNINNINSPKVDTKLFNEIEDETGLSKNKYWPLDFPEKRLEEFDFCRYRETRNFPYIDGSSKLSPYIRFGIISIRKIYKIVSSLTCDTSTFISELAWREFWYHIMHYFPETRDIEFQEKRRGIQWTNNEKWLEAWKEGSTGYPIVDAGMRQLKEEGWIHNRVRMVVASFLTKDLLIDWRLGDRHFFDYLIDYDENVDIGNWQWAASVGADPKQLRIFNPILQSQRFDPDCSYIKRYVPELKNTPSEKIHDPIKYNLPYHRPIINHYEMSKLAKLTYTKNE
ncbi:MAG: deoxyribodipyrimidine photo-lyase [Candidatus Dadabacteria bacterium]